MLWLSEIMLENFDLNSFEELKIKVLVNEELVIR
jgi:hypothetical protein